MTKNPYSSTISEVRRLLQPASYEFAERNFRDGIEKYATRIRQYGFSGYGRVLDAGCGFGQWSLALAQENEHVTGIDVCADRLLVLDRLIEASNTENVDVQYGSVEKLAFDDGAFDAVFCYGTLFLVRWRETIEEFRRVLRPGGRLYVNACGIGYYMHRWKDRPNETATYDPRSAVGRMFLNTLNYEKGTPIEAGGPLLVDKTELCSFLRANEFDDVQTGPEGTLKVHGYKGAVMPPFSAAEYDGEPGIYEVLALKQ